MRHPKSTEAQKFRLTASTICLYFKHRCDRLFRWNVVDSSFRGKQGIGWNVPQPPRSSSRAGIKLLMDRGNEFEVEQLRALIDEVGDDQVRHAGINDHRIESLSQQAFLNILQQRPLPTYIAQIELDFPNHQNQEERFLRHFNLDTKQIKMGVARPDLLEVIHPGSTHTPLLRIWDFKGSQAARHEHFIQVAYYSFLLEQLLDEASISDIAIDTEQAVIYTRKGKELFELAPYRMAVDDFLRNQVPTLLAQPAADVHYHVQEKCAMCEYIDICRNQADAGRDLSRIAYLSSESKRRIKQFNISSHTALADLANSGPNAHLVDQLRSASHDLSVNLKRYISTAQALGDGIPRPMESSTLLMPGYENIRIIISAEQDAVTGTCFALGLKTFEGWDTTCNRPKGIEEVFIANQYNCEGNILLDFLKTLNRLLERVDADNRAIKDESIDDYPDVVTANQTLQDALSALEQFSCSHKRLYKTNPQYEQLFAEREALKEAKKQAERTLKEAKKQAEREKWKRQLKLHFYVYDSIDLLCLKGLIERHLFTQEPPELLNEISNLVRIFPPESVLPDAATFRSIPGTVVIQVLRTLVALPVPYQYNLQAVSELYQPRNEEGQEKGFVYRPSFGFAWDHSNQIAFERIHDVWGNKSWNPDKNNPQREMSHADILKTIETTIRSKLRATDSVIRRIKQDMGDNLLLRKEPFHLYTDFDPLNFRVFEALRIFTLLEASYEELQVKHCHTLPLDDRTAKFECIRGLQHIPDADESDDSMWFTFDSVSRDAKFSEGDFNLVVTPQEKPELLLGDIDGNIFSQSRWQHRTYKVTLEEYDLTSDPPRVRLRPDDHQRFRDRLDLSQPCVLDRLYVDYNSPKVLDVLQRLQSNLHQGRHIHELTASGTVTNWNPIFHNNADIESKLRQLASEAGIDPETVLNSGQWRAWHGVFKEPLTLIWGPPGTGKTYTLGHILLGYALAASSKQQPIAILVTAFTHHAIVNVLKKVADLAERYGLSQMLTVAKVQGMKPHAADEELPHHVDLIPDNDVLSRLAANTSCLVIGSTVWSIYKAMNDQGGAIQPWFDVVLVDEASQLKLPDALIGLSASKPVSNIILAGDDKQLPPIIHGIYPEEHKYMLTSVFAFMRDRMEQRLKDDPQTEEKMLFQLEENFRMNEPLTAYPRDVLYRGRFFTTKPWIRMETLVSSSQDRGDLLDILLSPDKPSILCHYEAPRSFTARNPIEAELISHLITRLSNILLNPFTHELYTDEGFASHGVAVLSPHRAQNSTIRQHLREAGFDDELRRLPLVDTVDKLQGQERDIIFVSYGVADSEYAEAEADFLLSSNRFNVAATRAKHKLIVFCSNAVLNVVPTDKEVLLDSMMLKEFRNYCGDGEIDRCWQSAEYGKIPMTIRWKTFDRIESVTNNHNI
jgi:hypothetical protein